jgi:hypothetical protein
VSVTDDLAQLPRRQPSHLLTASHSWRRRDRLGRMRVSYAEGLDQMATALSGPLAPMP